MATKAHTDAMRLFELAAKAAQKSMCLRRQCGSVVVKDGDILGRGYNSPPLDDISRRRCMDNINKYAKNPTDKTCCMHAEQRAINNALLDNPSQLAGADLYLVSIDKSGEMEFAGKPYCTICSKLALDVGIARFGLWHKNGPIMYDTLVYNDLSYRYKKRITNV